jgi:hypothetical protein
LRAIFIECHPSDLNAVNWLTRQTNNREKLKTIPLSFQDGTIQGHGKAPALGSRTDATARRNPMDLRACGVLVTSTSFGIKDPTLRWRFPLDALFFEV